MATFGYDHFAYFDYDDYIHSQREDGSSSEALGEKVSKAKKTMHRAKLVGLIMKSMGAKI